MKLSDLCTLFNLSLFVVWDDSKGVRGEFTVCLRHVGSDIGFVDEAEQGYDQMFGEGPTLAEAKTHLVQQLPGQYMTLTDQADRLYKMPKVITPD